MGKGFILEWFWYEKEGVVIKVVGDEKSVFFISQSGMEEVMCSCSLASHKSVSLNCVFFFDVLNVHFLVGLYFLMYNDTSQFSLEAPQKRKEWKEKTVGELVTNMCSLMQTIFSMYEPPFYKTSAYIWNPLSILTEKLTSTELIF